MNIIRPFRNDRGFALVVSLAMLVLMVVTAVGLLSLASVSAKSTGISSAEQRAQSNARMALMLAIDKLQIQLGPDQRVSANAAILSDASVANPHWLGVWDSWRAGNGTYERYPDALSSHSTIFNGQRGDPIASSMHPTYEPGREDHFREWLVSLDEDNAALLASGRSLSLDASLMPTGGENAVILVGEGSLGDGAPSSQWVKASLMSVEPAANRGKYSGRYGWWIGDNSQKAIIMGDSYRSGETLTAAEKLFRGQAPGSTGTRVAAGLEDITNENQLNAASSLQTINLVDGVTGKPAATNFHSITTSSMGVLSDVREGGLKRDLSTLLERPINPDETSDEFMLYKFNVKDAWANDASIPNLTDTPQECVPIQDLAAYYQLYQNDPNGSEGRRGGINYSSAPLPDAIQSSVPDFGDRATFASRFKREYTTLYRQPVPIKVQFLVAIAAEPITAAERAHPINDKVLPTDTHKLLIGMMPAISLWNPNNVPITMNLGDLSQMLRVKPPAIWFDFNTLGTGASPGAVTLHYTLAPAARAYAAELSVTDIFRLNIGRLEQVSFAPGEVKVLSVPAGTNGLMGGENSHSFQNAETDAAIGWNPTGFLLARATVPLNKTPKKSDIGIYEKIVTKLDDDGNTIKSAGLAFNASSQISVQIGTETSDGRKSTTHRMSPAGSALNFCMTQYNFAPENGRPGRFKAKDRYGNLRSHQVLSRFAGSAIRGGAAMPYEFNHDLLGKGISEVNDPGRAGEFTIAPILGSALIATSENNESWPIMQFAMMAGCETNEASSGAAFGGRKFASRPFTHSSPIQSTFIDELDDEATYNHGWNWWIEDMNSVLEANVQVTMEGNGFYGGGYTREAGATHVVQQDLPVVPPISIATLSHAHLGGFSIANEAPVAQGLTGVNTTADMENAGNTVGHVDNPAASMGFQRVTAQGQAGLFPHTLQAIGNSYAHPCLPADAAYDMAWKRHYDHAQPERDVTFADHSYLANKALWDDFYFSSITKQPQSVEVFESDGLTAQQVATEFFFNDGKLPNRRMAPYTYGLTRDQFDAMMNDADVFTDGMADKLASHMMIRGPFNINSTSVESWKIFFSSLKGKPVPYLDGGSRPEEATMENTPVGFGVLALGAPIVGSSDDPSNAHQWTHWREISDQDIEDLSNAMVEQVKLRGPFLSLSEFVNRRLDGGQPELALKGALQAALDDYPNVKINEGFLAEASDARQLDRDAESLNGFAFPEALDGPVAYGSAAYVDQADVLRNFAAQLTPRGDTFTIRAYGDSLNSKGEVEARAWCEATVQRTPDYVDGSDEAHTKQVDLQSSANQLFGRKLKLVSFRWLNASEI